MKENLKLKNMFDIPKIPLEKINKKQYINFNDDSEFIPPGINNDKLENISDIVIDKNQLSFHFEEKKNSPNKAVNTKELTCEEDEFYYQRLICEHSDKCCMCICIIVVLLVILCVILTTK